MMKKEWIYHKPEFECDRMNKILYQYSPWAGLRSFAYDYILAMRPKTIVELGSHYGCSSFAFLQAIKDGKIPSSFFAVDTWEGDAYTKNDYQEDVIGAYKNVQDTLFKSIDAHMMRMTFDEAVGEFEDHSIDLLHIDGSHMYEDVKHDFMTWLPKVKSDGVIFFHDVGKELFKGEYMGSHVFWRELGEIYPYRIELPFSCGLGLLVLSQTVYRDLIGMIDVDHYQEEINIRDSANKAAVREFYFKIGSLEDYIEDLKRQKEILQTHLESYKADEQKKDEYIEDLKKQKEVLQTHLESYKADEQKKEEYIEELKSQKEVLESHLERYKTDEQKKKEYIEELEKGNKSLISDLGLKDKYISELEQNVQKLNDFADQKQFYAEKLEAENRELISKAVVRDEQIKEFEEQLQQLRSFADSKERYIAELQEQIKQLNVFADEKCRRETELQQELKELKEFADQKENYITELKSQIEELNQFVAGKEKYIAELEEDKKVLEEFARGKDEYAALLEEQAKEYRKEQRALLDQIETSSREAQGLRGVIEVRDNTIWKLSEEVQKARERINQCEKEKLDQLENIDNLKRLIEEEEKIILKIPFGDRILQRIKNDAK